MKEPTLHFTVTNYYHPHQARKPSPTEKNLLCFVLTQEKMDGRIL